MIIQLVLLNLVTYFKFLASTPRGEYRNFSEGFPYHSQWSSNFTAIFDGNSRFLPSIDLEKFYGQIKNMRWKGFLGTLETP